MPQTKVSSWDLLSVILGGRFPENHGEPRPETGREKPEHDVVEFRLRRSIQIIEIIFSVTAHYLKSGLNGEIFQLTDSIFSEVVREIADPPRDLERVFPLQAGHSIPEVQRIRGLDNQMPSLSKPRAATEENSLGGDV
jgi:hypothetical protein